MRKSADVLKEMDAIVATADNEARPMTDAEVAEFDTLTAEYDTLLAAESAAAATLESQTAERRAQIRSAHEAAESARRTQPTRTAFRAAGEPANREFGSLEEWAGAAVMAAVGRGNDSRLNYVNRQAEQSMGTGGKGGFLIPQQFAKQVLEIRTQATIVRSRATVIPAMDGAPDAEFTIPALDQRTTQNMYGGVNVSWIAEGGAKPATDVNFREVKLEPQEQAAHIVLSDKSMRNSRALGVFVAQKLPAALAASEDFAFLSGDGVGKPRGMIGSGAAYSESRATGGTVTYDDLIQMISRLEGNGVWVISRSAYATIVQIQDNSGGSPGVGQYIFSAQTNTLLGFPVVWSVRSPSLGSAGDVMLADMSYYLIKDGVGPIIGSSEHVYFLNNKTVIKAFLTVDGQPWLTEPITNEDGRQYSPFVTLAA